jgi:16S rRNA C1402 (ribose-2'-O) methylase RsmI
MQITIEVPDRLGEQLKQLGDRLPEALDRAVQELTPTGTTTYQDDSQIVELLASQPSPEVVLAIRPSPALQARMSELLAQNKSATLTRSEEVELVGVASLTRESLLAPRTLGAVSKSSCL